MTCGTCGNKDLDGVGWSVCEDCFQADRFYGFAYWAPMFCALAFLLGVGFDIAALVRLA